MRWSTGGPTLRESMPSTLARPDDGRSRFIRALIVVVLPAPFGPMNAYTLPAGTSIVRSRTASVRP